MDIQHRDTGKALLTVPGDSLVRANLRGADLCGANLYGADLCGADLRAADLRGADLSEANLYGANLYGANLYGADLCGADLRGADLSGADLSGADLSGANLRGANLRGANLRGANLPSYQRVPEEGTFIAFKKLSGGIIAKIEIPTDALRTSTPIGIKCRASFVKVLELSGGVSEAYSTHDESVVYRVGEIVRPDSYDGDIRVECTHGIHFFITRKDAEKY